MVFIMQLYQKLSANTVHRKIVSKTATKKRKYTGATGQLPNRYYVCYQYIDPCHCHQVMCVPRNRMAIHGTNSESLIQPAIQYKTVCMLKCNRKWTISVWQPKFPIVRSLLLTACVYWPNLSMEYLHTGAVSEPGGLTLNPCLNIWTFLLVPGYFPVNKSMRLGR